MRRAQRASRKANRAPSSAPVVTVVGCRDRPWGASGRSVQRRPAEMRPIPSRSASSACLTATTRIKLNLPSIGCHTTRWFARSSRQGRTIQVLCLCQTRRQVTSPILWSGLCGHDHTAAIVLGGLRPSQIILINILPYFCAQHQGLPTFAIRAPSCLLSITRGRSSAHATSCHQFPHHFHGAAWTTKVPASQCSPPAKYSVRAK